MMTNTDEIPLRLDNASSILEAQRIYQQGIAEWQLWYRKQLIILGSKTYNLSLEKAKLLEEIVEGLALTYGLEAKQIKSSSRKHEILYPRHCIIYTMIHKYKFSKKSVGKAIGGRDHSTAIHSERVVQNWIDIKYSFEEQLSLLKMIYPEKFE